jgi:tetratricopeptide (TPR) repeat protein
MKTLFSFLLGLSLFLIGPKVLGQPQAQPSTLPQDRAQILVEEGKVAFGQGNYQKALIAFQQAYEINLDLEYAINIGQCYALLSQWKEAITYYSLFLKGAAPNHDLRSVVEAEIGNAEIKLKEKNLADALQATASGESAFATERFAEAVNSFKRANDLMPSPDLLYKVAQCHGKLTQYPEALAVLDTLLQDKTASSLLLTEAKRLQTSLQEKQASALWNVGSYEEALSSFKKAYVLAPMPSLLFRIGECHRLLGDKKEARASYQEFLKKAPRHDPNRGFAETWSQQVKLSKPLLLGSGVSAGAGAVFGFVSLILANQVKRKNESPNFGVEDFLNLNDKERQRKVTAMVATSFFGVALVTGGLGLVLHQRANKAERQTNATVILTPSGVGVGMKY